ncbi:hypothetical protein RF11_12040 [Thelohanellus kitauei]|uniref:Uncharacterized protein n=1 Tax=Thelohanellus kitauei TaxID=669202 RepID=A0A0C2MX71_THEKT|nr:hypothetical protein RF11_12040 [Thelohanellus kitauei]
MFDQDNIDILTSDPSELIIELKNNASRSTSLIKCHTFESETHLEISGCNVSFQTRESNFINNYSIGYKFILNIKINYEIVNHDFQFPIDKKDETFLGFTLYYLSIQFDNFTQNCSLKHEEVLTKYDSLNSSNLVYPCGSDDKVGSVLSAESKYDVHILANQNHERPKKRLRFTRKLLFCISVSFLIYRIMNRRTDSNKSQNSQDMQ